MVMIDEIILVITYSNIAPEESSNEQQTIR